MHNLQEMTTEQLRILRGDLYQERENFQAGISNCNENIIMVNKELDSRPDAAFPQKSWSRNLSTLETDGEGTVGA